MITDSTIEVEYIAASEAAKKAFWCKMFAAEIRVMPSDAIPLYYDNNGAIVRYMCPRSQNWLTLIIHF